MLYKMIAVFFLASSTCYSMKQTPLHELLNNAETLMDKINNNRENLVPRLVYTEMLLAPACEQLQKEEKAELHLKENSHRLSQIWNSILEFIKQTGDQGEVEQIIIDKPTTDRIEKILKFIINDLYNLTTVS